MIFATVGTDTHDFSRFVKTIDYIASELDQKIIVQVGYSDYEPRNCKFFRFTSSNRIEELNKNAEVIISHGGAGSIIKALKYKKRPIVIPRRKKYNEHVNDHQIELVKKLSLEGMVIPCYNEKNLLKILNDALYKKKYNLYYKSTSNRKKLIKFLRNVII